jgi:PqqD family protein of HPr-rel-A system
MTLQAMDHWARRLTVVMPRRRRDVIARMLDGEAVLFDRATGCTHRMNETALRIWNACDGERTTEEAARGIAAHYDVDVETALADVEQTLAVLARAGMIEGTSA